MLQSARSTTTTKTNDHIDSFPSLSLKSIFARFKWRISFTLSLVTIETLLELLYPLFIGWAINDLLNDSYGGIYLLTGLGVITVLMGSARRFYDTRIYAHIYQIITPEMVISEKARKQSISTISARSGLLTEFVEFLENSLPEVITAIIGLAGVLLIISTLNISVFFACLTLLGLVTLVYLITGSLNYRLNAGYNTELENQVETIKDPDTKRLKAHFKRLMRWNIKLSDLETSNYLIIWIGVVALFVYTPIAAIDNGVANYGLIVSLLLYVLEYIEKVATLPLYVQQIIRLREIANRISL